MKREVLCELARRLDEKYGDAYSPWGTHPDETEGTGFMIAGIPATFSVLSFGDIPLDKLDVQIESHAMVPQVLCYDQYMHNGVYSVSELLRLVEDYQRSISRWPK